MPAQAGGFDTKTSASIDLSPLDTRTWAGRGLKPLDTRAWAGRGFEAQGYIGESDYALELRWSACHRSVGLTRSLIEAKVIQARKDYHEPLVPQS